MARPSDSQLDAQIEATLQAARDLGCEAAVKKDIELFDLLAEVDENDLVARLTTQYKLTHEKVGLIIKGISDEDFFFLAPHLGITEAVISRAKLIWKGIAPPMQPPPPAGGGAAAAAADKPPAAASAASDASADGLPPPPPPPGGADAAGASTGGAAAVAGAAGASASSSSAAGAAQNKPASGDGGGDGSSSTPEPPARRNSDSTTDAPGADGTPAGGAVFNTDDDGAGVTRDMKSRGAALSAHDNKASLLTSPKATGGAASPMSTSSSGSNAAAAGAGAGQVAGASFSGSSGFSSGMSFVTAPPDAKSLGSEKAHSYAEITHSFTIVSRQIENGLLSCKRVIAFLKKFTGEQQKYAKELIAITAHESNKIHKLQDDGMRRYNTAFGGFQEAMVDMSKMQEAYSNKILTEVVTPLTEYHAKAETRRKAILDDEKKVTTQMKACTDALTKQKLTCLRMLDALKTRKEKKTKEDDDKKKAGGAGAGFLSSLKSKVASVTESTMEEQTDKCYKELVVYQQQIKTSNERAKQYYTVELPRIFDQLQQLETQRLNTLRDYMKKYVDIQSGSMEPFKSMCMVLGRKVGGMHAASDMNEWVASIIKQHGAVPELRPFQYDLPITPEDVKANRLDPSENSNSLFRSTLPRIMELQKAKYPSLDLPKLIVTLVGWIREFDGGVKTKGLFRISASKDELLQLKKQLEKGDYDTKSNTNPHASAGLLKEFLRELSEPLFPQDLYNDCIAAVKDMENTPPQEMAKKVMGLFDKLPPLTQRVIKFVGVLLREVSSPDNAAVNLMTMDNLAIVFAPSLLRCPHDDPMEMLSNSKFETRFAAILFSSLH